MSPVFFIDRPVFSTVLSVLIVIVGIIGLLLLPVDQYPQITPPVVRVNATYPGASALTVSQAVATPIEQELNGTPGMVYMQSSSSNSGGLTVTITFEVGASPELSAVEIQNRVKLAEARLPAEVVQNGITVDRQSPSQLMTLSLISDDQRFDEIYLSNFATINVLDVLRRIPGVGRISNVGSRYYGMQIWVYPDRLANMGLTVQDLQRALQDQNRESAAGELGKQPVIDVDITLPVTAHGRLSTVEEFEDIVVRANPDGSIVRLRDVARVSLEASSYSTESGLNGRNAAILNIYMLPGANALEVAKDVRRNMAEISRNFPEGLEYLFPFDMTEYVSQSIHEVYKTLLEALLLVVLVVFLSLQNWRAALIPTIAVPISLIGTFGFMMAMGFSLNMLTLLGLILSIGIVVDDAIVVVENVERIMEHEKLPAREATHKAMRELAGALIATSLVLAAVFVPVSFLGGITGMLYRQFSITIAVSVILSTVVALTLSPAMCAILLRPSSGKKHVVFRRIDAWLAGGSHYYIKMLYRAVRNPRRVVAGFGLSLVLVFVLNRVIPSSFIPEEDQGFFTVELEMPEGATLERTRAVTARAIDFLSALPAVEYVQNLTGSSSRVGASQSRAMLTVILKPWSERKGRGMDVAGVMEAARKELYYYPEIKAYLNRPPVIPGLGESGGIEMQLEARGEAGWETLRAASDTFMLYAGQAAELRSVSSAMQAEIPQLYFDLDRDRAKFLGIPLSDVFSTMKAYLGSVYVNDFNMFNRIYRVYIQAEAPYRTSRDNIGMFFVRAQDGTMIPLTALGSSRYVTGPGAIKRFNMFSTASVSAVAAHGYSSGEAMLAMERIVKEHLPSNIGLEWSGLSYQEKKAQGQTGMVMGLVLLFVFLFLAALYESWITPAAVLLSLPVAVFGAYLGVWVAGLNDDIYFQIGLVTLMGLAAKNAILIVEFAKVEVDAGVDVTRAAVDAAKKRFRPILMTSLAFVLGMLPMVIASGPGSVSRRSIGTGVFAGMIAAITAGIVMVPFFFVLIHRIKEWLVRHRRALILAMPILALLTSCKIGHDYVRPDLHLPATIPGLTAADSISAEVMPWQSADTVLTSLIQKALTNNNDILSATARISEMAAIRRIAQAAFLPEVDGQVYAQEETLNYGGDNRQADPELGAKAIMSWEVDLWGNIRWRSEAALASYMQSVEAREALRLTIVSQVVSAYFELCSYERERFIIRQTVDARREGVRLARLRFEGGLTSETSYRQAEIELARTETMLPELEQKIALKENDLAFLVGEYPGHIGHIGADPLRDAMGELPPVGLPDSLPSTLLAGRPDMRRAEQELRQANASVGVAYTDMLPRIRLTGSMGYESAELSSFIHSPAWMAASAVVAPLLDMGRGRAKLKASRAAYEQAVYNYRQTALNAFREVSNALISLDRVRQVRRSLTRLEASAQSHSQLAYLQYINGITNYMDVLDAQRSLLDAQISLNHAILNEHLTYISLYKSIGAAATGTGRLF